MEEKILKGTRIILKGLLHAKNDKLLDDRRHAVDCVQQVFPARVYRVDNS